MNVPTAPISLAFREYGAGSKTLVVLHGLLGSSQNWHTPAKRLGQQHRVLVVDERNHGESPHTSSHTLADLREDLRHFLNEHSLDQVFLLGHSMGGLAAMEFAFHYPERLSGLIIEDIAPRAYGNNSGDLLDALLALPLNQIESRRQADELLAKTVTSSATRQFLLTNLVRQEDSSFAWKANLPILRKYQQEMLSHEPPVYGHVDGEALFIGGELSSYRIQQDHHLILQHFPNSRLEIISNAGHWLHFEAPDQFTSLVLRFMEDGLAGFNAENAR